MTLYCLQGSRMEIAMKLFKNYITVNNQKKGLTYDPVFYATLRELAHDPVVRQMKRYPHHGSTDCFRHCLHVAYFNYKICRALNLDYKAGIRAGMLHDLFLYDWHTHGKETGERLHGLTHPKKALQNARKHFKLNHIEEDVIVNHMWPVTLFHFPHTREGWVIVLTDKYCGLLETLKLL